MIEDLASEAEERLSGNVEEPGVEAAEESPTTPLTEPIEPEARGDEEPLEASFEENPRSRNVPPRPLRDFPSCSTASPGLTGFYGSQPVKVDPVVYEPDGEEPEEERVPCPSEAVVEESVEEEAWKSRSSPKSRRGRARHRGGGRAGTAPAKSRSRPRRSPNNPTRASEGTLQNKLTDVRAKADEARMAKLRANAALYEGLSAAYDFALDAEEAPEEYLRLVEAQGLKIQLRSPMKPVVKLAFDGMCDDMTIKQLEAVLAWAFDEELPRGTLAERIEAAGGIGPILSGEAKAA